VGVSGAAAGQGSVSGKISRSSRIREFFADFFKQAANRVGIVKNAIPHSIIRSSRRQNESCTVIINAWMTICEAHE
jgi:hypothetical protein